MGTIPGFITVSFMSHETNQPIHVRYQVRADLSIRGEQDILYKDFNTFIKSFGGIEEEEQLPQNIPEGKEVKNNISIEENKEPHVALYARTDDINSWVKESELAGEGEGMREGEVTSTLFEFQNRNQT